MGVTHEPQGPLTELVRQMRLCVPPRGLPPCCPHSGHYGRFLLTNLGVSDGSYKRAYPSREPCSRFTSWEEFRFKARQKCPRRGETPPPQTHPPRPTSHVTAWMGVAFAAGTESVADCGYRVCAVTVKPKSGFGASEAKTR